MDVGNKGIDHEGMMPDLKEMRERMQAARTPEEREAIKAEIVSIIYTMWSIVQFLHCILLYMIFLNVLYMHSAKRV